MAFLYHLLANTGGGPEVSYVRRLVRLLLDLPLDGSRDIDDEFALKPRLDDYLHFVCYDGCECDRIPAVHRPFVLRQYFQYRNLKGLINWHRPDDDNSSPKQLDQYPFLAVDNYLLDDYRVIVTNNVQQVQLAPLSLQSYALVRAQIYLQQALGRCHLISYHYHTYLHFQHELARIYGIPPDFSCLILPSLAEPSYIAFDGYIRFGFKTLFEEYIPFFVSNGIFVDKCGLWVSIYKLAVDFQFPICSTILSVIEENYLIPTRFHRYRLKQICSHSRYVESRRERFFQPANISPVRSRRKPKNKNLVKIDPFFDLAYTFLATLTD